MSREEQNERMAGVAGAARGLNDPVLRRQPERQTLQGEGMVAGRNYGILGMPEVRPVNDNIETLVSAALAFTGNNPTTEQQALDAIASVTLRELGNRARTIAAQNGHICELDRQLVSAYAEGERYRNQRDANYKDYRDMRARAELLECHLERIMTFLIPSGHDRVPYNDVPRLVAQFVSGHGSVKDMIEKARSFIKELDERQAGNIDEERDVQVPEKACAEQQAPGTNRAG